VFELRSTIDRLPEILKNLVNVLGCSIINTIRGLVSKRPKPIKSLFIEKSKSRKNNNIRTVPDGKGGFKKVRITN